MRIRGREEKREVNERGQEREGNRQMRKSKRLYHLLAS